MPSVSTQTTTFLPVCVPVLQRLVLKPRWFKRMAKIHNQAVKNVSKKVSDADKSDKAAALFLNRMQALAIYTAKTSPKKVKRADALAAKKKADELAIKKAAKAEKLAIKEAKAAAKAAQEQEKADKIAAKEAEELAAKEAEAKETEKAEKAAKKAKKQEKAAKKQEKAVKKAVKVVVVEEPVKPVTTYDYTNFNQKDFAAWAKTSSEEKAVAKAAAPVYLFYTDKPENVRPRDEEPWMIIRDNVKYWTDDGNEQNGPVYENTLDFEGDSTYGRQVGLLKDGVLELFVV